MMKFLILLFFLFFVINKFNKKLLFFWYQNLIFIMFFMLLMIFPFNNLLCYSFIFYNMGVDNYSWGLIMLSFWIISLMIMVSLRNLLDLYMNLFIYLMNFMLILLLMCFFSLNLILFYIYFESSLLPVFMLIMGWGLQIERIQASFYMMLYTLLGSMPLFIIILYLYTLEYSLNFNIILLNFVNFYVYISLVMAFFIKMPMYLVHLWLPKAHVEAPIVGSMILAGVMLKLGSYGLLRILPIMMKMSLMFNKYFLIFSLLGGLVSSLICLNQVDMKMLVAYSSVVHMSILMSGLMTLFNWGFMGGYLMMLAHGLCSSGLFCLVNINYERLMSRSLFINKGLINYFPSLSLMWFLLCSSNLSFPPSLNLFSEIFLFNSLLMWNKMLMLILMLISFFSACYTLYLYTYSQHGVNNFLNYLNGVKLLEFLLLFLHWIPLNLIFFVMILFI